MRVLSIDWDFFFEEDPMLDWGHRSHHNKGETFYGL